MSIGRTACRFPQRGSARRCEGHNMNRCEALCNPFDKTDLFPYAILQTGLHGARCSYLIWIKRRTCRHLQPALWRHWAEHQVGPHRHNILRFLVWRIQSLSTRPFVCPLLKSRVCLRINNSLALHVTVVFTRVLYGPGPYPNQTRFTRARTNSHFRS